MTDPAVEAARRIRDSHPYCGHNHHADSCLTDAAREALKPIRELHKPREWEWHTEPRISCICGLHPWPCDTAKLIYTTEELT